MRKINNIPHEKLCHDQFDDQHVQFMRFLTQCIWEPLPDNTTIVMTTAMMEDHGLEEVNLHQLQGGQERDKGRAGRKGNVEFIIDNCKGEIGASNNPIILQAKTDEGSSWGGQKTGIEGSSEGGSSGGIKHKIPKNLDRLWNDPVLETKSMKILEENTCSCIRWRA